MSPPTCLAGGHFLFTPPSTYVFSGAEVFVESEDSDSPSPAEEESDSSFSSDEEEEAAGTGSAMECEAADRPPMGQQGSPGRQDEAETARGS